MGIRFTCPNGHKLHVKTFLAGKRGVCPQCGVKILIPSADEPQQLGAIAPAENSRIDPVVRVGQSAPLAVTSTDIGSQSIIIAVADSSVATPPIVNTPVSIPPPVVAAFPPGLTNGPPPTVPELPTVAPPFVVSEAIEPVSPAVQYVAQRERNRRNQFTIAVFLLLAVILLAGVLIWVLQHGSTAVPVGKAPPTSLYDPSASRYVAVSFDRCLAHNTQVAT